MSQSIAKPRTEFRLSNTLEAHGEQIDVLRLRAPVASDLAESGMPFTISPEGGINFNPRAVIALVARLAAVPPSTVGSMSLADFTNLQQFVFGFFGQTDSVQTEPESSQSVQSIGSQHVSTSPTSGDNTQSHFSDLHGPNSISMPNRRLA